MKTEKRIAKEGESIVITNAVEHYGELMGYQNGDVIKAEEVWERVVPGAVSTKEMPLPIYPEEYEVIIEEDEPNA